MKRSARRPVKRPAKLPLAVLLPRARSLGSVTFQTVEGVGWQCTIRPPHKPGEWSNRGLNSWAGTGKTLAASLRAALRLVAEVGRQTREGAAFAPRLGGKEFDDE